METRVDKYSNKVMSRTEKNHHLYEEISNNDITTFDVNSNTEVLGNNSDVIDVAKLRDMLDKKYREEPKKNKLAKFNEHDDNKNINLDETKEYDINKFMDKAKENKKEEDYEIERLKKLKNTQFDILNNLDLPKLNEEEIPESKVASKDESDKLMELINTINITEATNKNKDMNPLDILSDLKGNEDTRVFGAQELQEIEDSSASIPLDKILEKVEEKETEIEEIEEEEENIPVEEPKEEVDKTFFTASNKLSKKDFDDFKDLEEEVSSSKIIIKILIVIVVLAFIFGIFFILNKVLEWGII